MAIKIGDNFSYNGELFIDQRQGIAKSKEDLKNWSTSVPEGFEVYFEAEKEWYTYNSANNNPETGKFEKRNKYSDEGFDKINQDINRIDTELDEVRQNIDTIEGTIQSNYDELNQKIEFVNEDLGETNNKLDSTIADIENRHSVIYADKKSDLILESSWIIAGKNYVEIGIIVSVINDGENNGVYQLKAEDYKNINNWRRILDIEDLITSTSKDITSSDSNLYTAKKTDEKFIRRDIPEVINQSWTFNKPIDIKDKITIGDNEKKIYLDQETGEAVVDVDRIIAKKSELEDLPEHIWENTDLGVTNLLRNSGFDGDYDYLELDPDKGMSTITPLYNKRNDYWLGYGTWIIEEDSAAVSGFSVKMLGAESYLEQELPEEILIKNQSYIVSFKSKGNITVKIDSNLMNTSSPEYNQNKMRFIYSGENKKLSLRFTGTGNICDIKLERGNVSSGWIRNDQDPSPIKDDFKNYEYLKTAFGDENTNITSGIKLKNVIQIGETSDPSAEIKGGISGIYRETAPFLWTGGSFKDAGLTSGILDDPRNNKKRLEELDTKFLLTYDGKLYADEIVTNKIINTGSPNVENITLDLALDKVPSGWSNQGYGYTEEFELPSITTPLFITAALNFGIRYSYDVDETQATGFINIGHMILPKALSSSNYTPPQWNRLVTPTYIKHTKFLSTPISEYVIWHLKQDLLNTNYRVVFTFSKDIEDLIWEFSKSQKITISFNK